MREILANNLQSLFDNTSLNGKCTYRGNTYEVWEVSDEDFKIMCDMSEEEFEKVCPDGMWRSSEGSSMSSSYNKWIINNNEILAWDGGDRENYFEEYCKDCEDYCDDMCEANNDDILNCCGERKYDTLLNYMCDEIGASQPKNVCALAVDLAKANNMKMSDLFKIYEG